MMADLQYQAIRQRCKALRMPTIGSQFARLAEEARQGGQSHVGYLEALLAAEMEERESRAVARMLHEARLPRMKTLDAFEFDRSDVSAAQIRSTASPTGRTSSRPAQTPTGSAALRRNAKAAKHDEEDRTATLTG